MTAPLPSYVVTILPPLYVAFTRVLSRSKLSGGDLLTLFLLRSSAVTLEGRKVLLLTDLLDRICASMGYLQAAPASDLVGKLHNAGLIQKVNLTETQRKELFPTGKRTAAVLLKEEGNKRFEQFCAELDEATRGFLNQLPAGVRDQFYALFETTAAFESLVPVLQDAFLTGPDNDLRFQSACGSFLRVEPSELPDEIKSFFQANVYTLPAPKMNGFLDELERSVAGTPSNGLHRRSGDEENTDESTLLVFLDTLLRKHRDA